MTDMRGKRALVTATLAGLQRRRLTSSHRLGFRGGLRAALVLGAFALTLSVGVPPAYAAVISVNETADELNADGDCSLREAIQAANTNTPVDACPTGTPGPDMITFSVNGTITLTMGQLTITDHLTIDGPGAASLTISGGGCHFCRVLEVSAGVALDLRSVTVANGRGPVGGGGGILNNGASTVTNSIFSANSGGNGGGIVNGGGATLTVASSTFSGNSGGTAGAIWNDQGGTVNVTDTTFSVNTSPNYAGAIENYATFNITNSTFSGNSAPQDSGAIRNNFSGTLTVTNSTFSGNSAGSNGGGIFNVGTLTVTNSTFSGNSAGGSGGGIFQFSIGTATLRNTIVANSPGGNCSGVIIDGGGNLQHPGMDCGLTIPSADPLLGPLAANDGPAPDPPDGPTKTHALLPESPAIDAAVACPPPTTDQRGVSRPQGAGCDIGAFELEVAVCPPGDDDLDDDGLDDESEDLFGNLLNDDDSDDDGIRDGNDDGDDDGEDDEDEDDESDPCPEDGDGDGVDDEDEDDEEDDD